MAVGIGDPHNDQVAAAVMNDLMNMVRIMEDNRDGFREQGVTDEAAILAATSVSLQESELTRETLASLFGAALNYIVRKQEDMDEVTSAFESIVGIMSARADRTGFGWMSKHAVAEEYDELLGQLVQAMHADLVVLEPDLEEKPE